MIPTPTSVSIEDGLDFILSHLEEPHFPRRISTYLSENNPPWQFSVNSRDEALAKFKESDLLNCRISAYPYPVPRVRDINAQRPNFFMGDLDKKDCRKSKSFDQCLEDTLQNFKDKLHGANPSVLWSGGGYHTLQPLDADIVLEMESVFSGFYEPSIGLMRYAEKLVIGNNGGDPVHRNTVSFKNCMIRIPGSYNVKYIKKDGEITPESEVKIVQRWDGYKPNIRWLLRDYRIHLIQERNTEVLARLRKDQRRLRSRWKKGIEPSQYQQQTGKIDWIELLYNKPLDDFREYCTTFVFLPYFVNIKRVSLSEASRLTMNWLDRCDSSKHLSWNPRQIVNHKLKRVKNFQPQGLEKLKKKNNPLYIRLRKEGIVC